MIFNMIGVKNGYKITYYFDKFTNDNGTYKLKVPCKMLSASGWTFALIGEALQDKIIISGDPANLIGATIDGSNIYCRTVYRTTYKVTLDGEYATLEIKPSGSTAAFAPSLSANYQLMIYGN